MPEILAAVAKLSLLRTYFKQNSDKGFAAIDCLCIAVLPSGLPVNASWCRSLVAVPHAAKLMSSMISFTLVYHAS
eukprot:12278-Heterococcus_DN1.PRE.3